jgi:hypothetical protein
LTGTGAGKRTRLSAVVDRHPRAADFVRTELRMKKGSKLKVRNPCATVLPDIPAAARLGST